MNRNIQTDTPFSALLQAAVDGIIVIDNRGYIEVVNPAAERLFGYEEGELIGMNVSQLMPLGDREHHDGYIAKYLQTGERKMIGIGRETVGQKKDKSCFPMYLSVGSTESEDNMRFVGIIRDLTKQKREHQMLVERDQEVRQLRERLVHVARISTLGEMVTGIAHEVNQPLTAIATYTQACVRLIKAGLSDPDALLEALDRTSFQARRAAKVITKIRNFSKKSPIVTGDHDCNELIKEVVVLAQIHADELGVELVMELHDDGEPLMVTIDAIQTQQVVLNLIHNAIESMAGVDKNIAANDSGDNCKFVIQTRLGKDMVEIRVIDRGVGIDNSAEQQIFDPFFSTKSTGLGMGLSICQSIVNSQGGKLTFERNPDRGCTFLFTLPASIGESA